MLKLRHKILAAALLFTSPIFTVAQTAPPTPKTPAPAAATGLLDINTANPDQLKALPGIGDAYAKRIIDNRPFTSKDQLASKGIIPQKTYDGIKNLIIAKHAPSK
ncbi:helix-hairpin-helix protein [Edaphobacter aggregans]|uniref:Helix-hairpin-helix protein n=1 Tax=Edaphobacter aggregans TaxID=570835 RepID=A0A428MM25_9BACT|nr:helix-hairpin-helix domain-containing protein [Edaphobacter aggregans]RSL17915.1 helix-hairpin-helix protein [Edaphobacter aggregans]